MFSLHNGHNFILIDDAVKSLNEEMNGLFITYDKLRALEASKSQRNERSIKEIQKQLEDNKNTQVKFIRQGFDKIIEALVNKKNELIRQNIEKYEAEADNYARFSRQSSVRDKAVDQYKEKMQEIQEIRDDQAKSETLKKIRLLQNLNKKFGKEVEEAKRISENTHKLESMDSSAYKTPQLGEDFTPKTIDSTSAISYIVNMTLENNSLSKGRSGDSLTKAMSGGTSGSGFPVTVKYGNNHETNKPTIATNSINDYHHKGSNTGKNTVDTDKGTVSGRDPATDYKPGYSDSSPNFMKNRMRNRKEEEKKAAHERHRPNQVARRQSGIASQAQRENATGFYCIGDLPIMLFYHTQSKKWSKIEFSEESLYKGGLKYPSIMRLCKTDDIMITGG